MPLTRIVSPETEPLTLAEAKLHLRVEPDVTDDDSLITGLIQAAREYVESATNRAFLEQTWRLTLDRFPCDDIVSLGMPGVSTIDTFTYVDTSGAVVPFTAYTLDADAAPARIVRAYGTIWPTTRVQRNAVSIRFLVGAEDASEVPASIKAAMQLLIANWYKNREALIESRFALEVPFSVNALLAPYRRPAMEMA